ncbi:hypothetical protein GCM10027047_35510 [Rhodococcus aerolatus]
MLQDAGGAALTIGGKQLVFEPETIAATIAHFEGILDQVRQFDALSFTGEPAALDLASANAVKNLRASAESLFVRLDEAQVPVQAAIDNLKANGSAYRTSDVTGPASAQS